MLDYSPPLTSTFCIDLSISAFPFFCSWQYLVILVVETRINLLLSLRVLVALLLQLARIFTIKSIYLICREMASHIVGYPRMGPKRELKFALESFWDGKSSAEDLEKVAADLRVSIWKQMSEAGIKYIPSNTFSCYDQVLDTTAMLGAVPERYSWTGGEIGFDTYFSMARGNASVPAMEMTKWFDTN